MAISSIVSAWALVSVMFLRIEELATKNETALRQNKERIERFIYKFKQNTILLGESVEILKQILKQNRTILCLDEHPDFILLLKQPTRCNYSQYTSSDLLGNKLIKDFEKTITTTTEHDNRIKHINRVLIGKIFSQEKCTHRNIQAVKVFYEQTIDDINNYIKEYDKLLRSIKSHLKEAERLRGKRFLSKKDIQKLKDDDFQ